MFWRDHKGIECYASHLMVLCIKGGRLGDANLLLEFLEEERGYLMILPCERATLIMAADAFNQGVNPKLIADFLKRIEALTAWDHDSQKAKGMELLLAMMYNFHGKACETQKFFRNPRDPTEYCTSIHDESGN